ncbi:MAG: prephenate dehydrogenase [Dehalococcoidia bacterium]|nr:prephenate dehydrogenase [Dehalococcoidia bacterium]
MKKKTVFKVGIIGGYGKMGRWLARFLQKEGNEVIIAGRDQEKLLETAKKLKVRAAPNIQAVSESDAVILSVPIDSFETIVKEIAPFTRDGQHIFDVTSVKARPVGIMHKYIQKGTILGAHPMFGPGASGINGQRFVLTPVGRQETDLAEKVRGYLEGKGAVVAVMPPEEHDELMGIVLGLSHFIALVTADTLASLGKIKESEKVSGTTYRILLKMAESVVSEDPYFYSSLQLKLPGIVNLQKLFTGKAGEWASLVKEGRQDEFIARMKSLKDSFEKEDLNFASAYGDIYRIIEE